jgi:hypothetical protein
MYMCVRRSFAAAVGQKIHLRAYYACMHAAFGRTHGRLSSLSFVPRNGKSSFYGRCDMEIRSSSYATTIYMTYISPNARAHKKCNKRSKFGTHHL